ncbi:unnamed protein product, partial [Mesorhabditis belari]|uniref:CCR4-NOT transcription complex subunit 3 n=1 Tax=Mesorhabditis belari TaxID=2138241 RepID=A0AAF3E9K9_9BILA
MAEKRKLLSEIDKCFKKIDEGVEEFEMIMNKMQDANSDNQRDKYQDDLKREIKKLQRLRDSLKGWQNNPDIKDKDKLIQYRRLIELRMEQFKDIERENKTKPHSKVGLCAEEKVDPKEREKGETTEWLQNMINDLEVEVDRTETLIESQSQAEVTTKKGRKGKDDSKKSESMKKLEDLKKHHERMKFHIQRLELCMRLVSNETLEPRQVLESLKDQVEMFVASLDPDYDGENGPSEALDPEGAYEELDLGSYATTLGGVVHVSSIDHENERHGEYDNGILQENGHILDEELPKSRHGSAEAAPLSPALLTKKVSTTMMHKPVLRELSTDSPLTSIVTTTPAPSPAQSVPSHSQPQTPVAPPPGIPYNSIVTSGLRSTPPAIEVKTPPPMSTAKTNTIIQPAKTQPQQRTMSFTTVTTSTMTPATATGSRPSSPRNNENHSPPSAPTATANVSTTHQTFTNVAAKNTEDTLKTLTKQMNTVEIGFNSDPLAMPSQMLHHSPVEGGSLSSAKGLSFTSDSPTMNSQMPGTEDAFRQILRTSQTDNTKSASLKALIPPWLGASPLGRTAPNSELEAQVLSIDQVLMRCPPYLESERPRCYLPKLSCSTPAYYPTNTLAHVDTLEYYLRLSPEVLFFAFYYMEGSRAQLLAAKALKRLSWRFHTKYLMWFQRHEEPKEITDDFERGTYIYFDYEKWAQRKKESFVFEYRYLEDKDFD